MAVSSAYMMIDVFLQLSGRSLRTEVDLILSPGVLLWKLGQRTVPID